MRDPPRSHWALRTTCYRATRVERRNAERTFIEQLSDAREPLVQARFTSENDAVILQREATRIGYAPASFLPGRSRRYSRKQISSPLPDIVNKRRLARLGIERASGSYAREEVDGGDCSFVPGTLTDGLKLGVKRRQETSFLTRAYK
jgi:hypothetical protein